MSDTPGECEIVAPVLALVGPTATGKTSISLLLSRNFNCEIISVDSMQVYRYMDIGTAKATSEERSVVPHHLIDIVDPDEEYNASRFVFDCLKKIKEIHLRQAIPLLVGGTGLYLRALKDGLLKNAPSDSLIRQKLIERAEKEECNVLHQELSLCDSISAANIHPNDRSRLVRALEVFLSSGIPLSEHIKRQRLSNPTHYFKKFLTIGLTCRRDLLYERINKRSAIMLNQGLENEVRGLLARGYSPNLKSMQSIGYRHMLNFISGKWSEDELKEILARDTRRYAKRQFTWFNKDTSVLWFDHQDNYKISEKVSTWLNH